MPYCRHIIAAIILASAAAGAAPHHERYYQRAWCAAAGGRAEVTLPDRTRADCITASHAIEFDFGSKWAESIGQSLYYATVTGRHAGIVLITPVDKYRYWLRLNTVIDQYRLPITTWRIAP